MTYESFRLARVLYYTIPHLGEWSRPFKGELRKRAWNHICWSALDKRSAIPLLTSLSCLHSFLKLQQRYNGVFEANVKSLEDDDTQEGMFRRRLCE